MLLRHSLLSGKICWILISFLENRIDDESPINIKIMINNNPYSLADRSQPRNSSGYQAQRVPNRRQENVPQIHSNSLLKKSAILMGNQQQGHRIETPYMGLVHSPRNHTYQQNFPIPRNNNPNSLSQQVNNQNTISQLNPTVSSLNMPIKENSQTKFSVVDKIQFKLKALQEKIEKISGTVDKHDSKLNNFDQCQMESVRAVLIQIKTVKKNFQKDQTRLQNMTFELQIIKRQVSQIDAKSASVVQQKMGNFENYVLRTFALNEQQIIDKVNSSDNIKKLEKNISLAFSQKFASLEQGINSFKTDSGIGQRIKDLEQRVQNQVIQQMKEDCVKKSLLKSGRTPIILKYIQNFRMKWGDKNMDRDINIAETVYQIDSEGFLLDEDNHYLLDVKNVKLKLDEKHIVLLKKYDIMK